MFKFILVLIVAILIVPLSATYASASEVDMDVLVDSMVNNGLLTREEAEKIIERSQKNRLSTQTNDEKKDTPGWKKKIALTGDMTVRYEQEKKKSTATPFTRFSGRLRYRLGVIAQINEKVEVGGGLTSGTSDPRSAFQTFTNSFEKGDVRLDYAYGEWRAAPWASAIVGKYPRDKYLWTTTDMMWDSDIRPTGASIHLETPGMASVKGFINGGALVIAESANIDNDLTMGYIQPGVSVDNDHFDFKASVNRYVFNKSKGVGETSGYSHSSCTNKGLSVNANGDCSGSLALEYDSGGSSVEAGYKFNAMGRPKRIAIFGDYVKNLTTSDNNTGYAGGVRLGDQKIKSFADWQANYQYTYLERDAVLDILPSSDRYDGQTNVSGFNTGFNFGLWKDIKMGLNYYRDNKIIGTKVPRTSLLADVTYKF